jgi:hypothetical protein
MGQDAGAWVEQKLGFLAFIVEIICLIFLERWLQADAAEETKTAEEQPA